MSEKPLVAELETSDFFTWFRGRNGKRVIHRWIAYTCEDPIPLGSSNAKKGDLRKSLRKNFGASAIGST